MSDGFAFAGYRLLPSQRLLLDGEQPVRLGSRALDLLIALVERAGDVVPTAALVERVWPRTVVGDDNLRVQVAALRKRLAEGRGKVQFIGNVPLRGYCFVAPVAPIAAEPEPLETARAGTSPLATTSRIIGREAIIEALVARLPERRFVTLVGPGGMGKTTVALAVADATAGQYSEPAVLVELAPLSDSKLVPAAVAAALGLSLPAEQPMPALVGALRDRRLLLVLDNCEHLICEVATLAAVLHRQAPNVHILATSREPLRVPGEWVQRLAPLALPPPSMELSAQSALLYTSVQLFVERASASSDSFELADIDAASAGEICRRLDGIPLAIELAAARVGMFGVQGVAARLNDRFALLTRGPRTAMPRQQTLRATLDWSHDCLAAPEQLLLRRLAVFKSAFTLEAAAVVASQDVIDPLTQLVDKCLVVTVDDHYYRLLESTRAYALDKLADSGELVDVRRRHAQNCLRLLRDDTPRSIEARLHALEEIRAALDWASGSDPDAALGIAITAAASPLAIGLCQMTEFRRRVEAAISRLDAAGLVGSMEELLLQRALGDLLLHTEGPGPAMLAAFRRCHTIATENGNPDLVAMSTGGLWVAAMALGDYSAASQHCDKLAHLLPPEEVQQRLPRMRAQTACFLGDANGATAMALDLLKGASTSTEEPGAVHVDVRVSMRIVLARAAWLVGQRNDAVRWAEESVQVARDLDHAIAMCYATAFAAYPIAFDSGDADRARSLRESMAAAAERHGLAYYGRWAEAYAQLERGIVDTAPDSMDPRMRAELQRLNRDMQSMSLA